MRNLLLHALLFAAVAAFATAARAQSGPYQYYSLTPCRVVDTRNPVGVNGGPALGTGERDFQMKGNCGIPQTAQAVTINVTVTNATTSSYLTIWPAALSKPFVSTLNFDQNTSALANGAIVGISAGASDLAVYNPAGQVHVIIDVTGYFQ